MSEDLVAAVLEAIPRNAGMLGFEEAERLIAALSRVDDHGDAASGRVAMAEMAGQPKLITRLDQLARQMWGHWRSHTPSMHKTAKRLRAGGAGPVGIALASIHGDGYVRELAVLRMLEDPDPDLMPFLVLRTADWVPQVRDRARAGLAVLLHDDPRAYLVAAAEMTALVHGRSRGSFAHAQLLAAASRTPRQLWDNTRNVGPAARRIAFGAAVFARALPLDGLVRIAERDSDPVLSSRAAEVVCREAVWTNRTALLARRARCRRAQVRGLAVTGLVRVGQVARRAGQLPPNGSSRATVHRRR